MAWQNFLTRVDNYDDLAAQVDFEAMEIPERFNIASAILDDRDLTQRAITEVYADRTHRDFTYGDLLEQTHRLANALRERGIGEGDVVMVINPQSFHTATVFLAAWRMGAIVLPVSTLFGPQALDYRFENSGAKAVITFAAHADAVREGIGERDVRLLVIGGSGEESFEDAVANASPDFTPVDTRAEDPAFLVYTSGTTGHPKGALHAHRQVFGQMPLIETCYDFLPHDGDVFWSPADWAWIAGIMCIMCPGLLYGVPLVVDRADGFDPARSAWLMREFGVTISLLPATALRGFRASGVPGGDFSMRVMMSGGEPLGAELREWAQGYFGGDINDAWGQTEMNGFVLHSSRVYPTKPGAGGRPGPGNTVAVVDDDFNPVIGQVGQVVARRTPLVMLKYWKNPEATAAKFRDGWLLSGDLGLMDADGYVWFKMRNDDVINASGYRIGPTEIEDCLCAHPAVALAGVIGVPDERRGQAPKAFVVPRPGVEGTAELADELRMHVRTKLAAHEVPREIVFVDDLPRTATGKILRRELRDH